LAERIASDLELEEDDKARFLKSARKSDLASRILI
jgi:hypothetical protein